MELASLFGISVTAIKVITSLSGYVDKVQGACNETQGLSFQVSTVYAIISELKVVVALPAAAAYMEDWHSRFEPLLVRCYATLTQIEDMVKKAKVKDKCSSGGQVVKRIMWTFKTDQVKALREDLKVHQDNLKFALEVLSRARDDNAHAMIEDIQARIMKWDERHKNIKETFVSVSSPDDPRVSLLMADLRGREMPRSPDTSSLPNVNQGSDEDELKRSIGELKDRLCRKQEEIDRLRDDVEKQKSIVPELEVLKEKEIDMFFTTLVGWAVLDKLEGSIDERQLQGWHYFGSFSFKDSMLSNALDVELEGQRLLEQVVNIGLRKRGHKLDNLSVHPSMLFGAFGPYFNFRMSRVR